jgi:hypothetical protein
MVKAYLEVRSQKVAVYCGEGYYNRTGPKSMLGIALSKAKKIVGAINE